ncbi:uncharacterized protein TNCV_2699901 [Trichonephila clavipes]|nr:uncharacterized protein TNCV_2699901 [Trichonephila clavipes]
MSKDMHIFQPWSKNCWVLSTENHAIKPSSRKSSREFGGRVIEVGATDHPWGVLPQNWDETELNRSVTCTVLKATDNDRRHLPFAMRNFVGRDLAFAYQVGMTPNDLKNHKTQKLAEGIKISGMIRGISFDHSYSDIPIS